MTSAIALVIAAAIAVVVLGRMVGVVSGVRDLGLRLDASASVGEEVVGTTPDTLVGERQATMRIPTMVTLV